MLIKHRCDPAQQKSRSSPAFLSCAGPVGIEPTLSVLETDVLPLNYGPYRKTITEKGVVGKSYVRLPMSYTISMRIIRAVLPLLVFGILAFAPHPAFAADATFFGPIIPPQCHCETSAPDFRCVLAVMQNVINFAFSISVIIFVLVAAYAGFLLMFSSVNSENKSKAKGMLTNVVIGLLIALSAWLIVDFIMKTLTRYEDTDLGAWNSILGDGGDSFCLKVTQPNGDSSSGDTTEGTGVTAGGGTGGSGTGTTGSGSSASSFRVGDRVECQRSGSTYTPGTVAEVPQTQVSNSSIRVTFESDRQTVEIVASKCRTRAGTGGTNPTTEGSISSRICTAANAYIGQSTNACGCGGNACAWAVNQVLSRANIRTIGGNQVTGIESGLQGGRGNSISQSSAQCGDLVLVTGAQTARGNSANHIGICLNSGCTEVISNSSSNRSFTWRSGPTFTPSYVNATPRFYRVAN